MPLLLVERLSVLALAATGCPDQCRSHVRAVLRLGHPAAALREDLAAAGWLPPAARARAEELVELEAAR